MSSRKGFLVGYIGRNIYKIYLSVSQKVEQLRGLIFVEKNKSLLSFYYSDFASNMSIETLYNSSATSINNSFYPTEEQNEIPETQSDISLVNSEIETSPRRSGRIRHVSQ